MKIRITAFWLILLFTGISVGFGQPGTRATPPTLIFDTDMGPDYDDVGAITLLHALADSGQVTILATIASNQSPYIAPVLDVLNTYFGRPDLPIGVVEGRAVKLPARQKWDSLLVANYPHSLKSNREAEEATALYRRLLAAQPDGSVTIVTVGFLTNMANLLESKPDKYSSLDGVALVKKKVRQLVSMAGHFGSQMGTFGEFNVKKDVLASIYAFDHWPTPILFSGFEIGDRVVTGLPLVNSPYSNSPPKDVFARSIPMDKKDVNGRMSWDQTAVLVAIKGYEAYYSVVEGRMVTKADGSNTWDRSGKGHFYLVEKMPVEGFVGTGHGGKFIIDKLPRGAADAPPACKAVETPRLGAQLQRQGRYARRPDAVSFSRSAGSVRHWNPFNGRNPGRISEIRQALRRTGRVPVQLPAKGTPLCRPQKRLFRYGRCGGVDRSGSGKMGRDPMPDPHALHGL